ncbi:MAG: glycoside hydrolase family 16 protein [Planctomycetes bacterium]|nr:glycoside hydrolase family 16 protein [Planctomycetota bacterium]
MGPGVKEDDEGRYKIGVLTIDTKAPIPGPGEKTLDLTDYRLTFDEEFDDLSVSAWGPAGPEGTRWIAHTPWRGDFGDAQFTDPRPDFPFIVKDGILRIEARKEGGRWRSGLLSAVDPQGNGFKQEYGYFECRARFPEGPGTWPAFWLMGLKNLKGLPENTGPRINPEVDVVEHYGHWPWRFSYVLHQWGFDGVEAAHEGQRIVAFGLEEAFHTYGVMIDEDEIVFYFDGVEIHRRKTPEGVKTPLYPLVNLALGPGWPLDKTPDPSYMYVDYVKVWKKGKHPAK